MGRAAPGEVETRLHLGEFSGIGAAGAESTAGGTQLGAHSCGTGHRREDKSTLTPSLFGGGKREDGAVCLDKTVFQGKKETHLTSPIKGKKLFCR